MPSNPRRLEVTWQTPSTWPDPESFPLKFFLRYRPLILDQWQHVSTLPCPIPDTRAVQYNERGNCAPGRTGTNRGQTQWWSERLSRARKGSIWWTWEHGWSQGKHPHQNMPLRTPRVVERITGGGGNRASNVSHEVPSGCQPRPGMVLCWIRRTEWTCSSEIYRWAQGVRTRHWD